MSEDSTYKSDASDVSGQDLMLANEALSDVDCHDANCPATYVNSAPKSVHRRPQSPFQDPARGAKFLQTQVPQGTYQPPECRDDPDNVPGNGNKTPEASQQPSCNDAWPEDTATPIPATETTGSREPVQVSEATWFADCGMAGGANRSHTESPRLRCDDTASVASSESQSSRQSTMYDQKQQPQCHFQNEPRAPRRTGTDVISPEDLLDPRE